MPPTDLEGADEAGIRFIARVVPGQYNPFESKMNELEYTIKDLSDLAVTLEKIMQTYQIMPKYKT